MLSVENQKGCNKDSGMEEEQMEVAKLCLAPWIEQVYAQRFEGFIPGAWQQLFGVWIEQQLFFCPDKNKWWLEMVKTAQAGNTRQEQYIL